MNETHIPFPYQLLNVENDAFTTYCFWSAVLVIKMVLMTFITVFWRIKKKAPISREDLTIAPKGAELKIDEDVERVRRAHLNDMENILPYLIICFPYLLTDPNTTAACWLFRIAALARIMHTVVYVILPIRQPARMICFAIAAIIMTYMSIMVMIHFFIVHF